MMKRAFTLFKDTFDPVDDIPNDTIPVFIVTKNKYYVEVDTLFTGSSNFSMEYRDFETGEIKQKDPEETSWNAIVIDVAQMIKIAHDLENFDYSKIEEIRFSCDDYDMQDVEMLRLMFKFFERHDCSPDASDTEHEFMVDDQNSFINKLISN